MAVDLVSAPIPGLEGQLGNWNTDFASISGDGRIEAFQSTAGNLAPNTSIGTYRVYAKDLSTGDVNLVASSSFAPKVSANGRHVAFVSDATNLECGRDDGTIVDGHFRETIYFDVFVKDLSTKWSRPIGMRRSRWM